MPPYSIAGSDPVPQIPMGCPDLPVAVGMGVGGAVVGRRYGLGNAMVREIGTFSAEMLITGKGNNTPRFPRLIVTIPPGSAPGRNGCPAAPDLK